MIKERLKMKTRGFRFSDELWDRVCREAAKDKTNRTYPSDIVRYAVGVFLDKQEQNTLR